MSQPHLESSLGEARATLLQCYADARQQAGPGPCIVALHLGLQQCGIAVGTQTAASHVQWLPLGQERTAAAYFKSTPPTARALEHAIMVVEDVVMPLHTLIPHGAQLFGSDAALHEIAQVSGLSQGHGLLSLEALERSFNRFCDGVQGMPTAHLGLPDSLSFAAALLILREFMHHLQFAHLTLLEQPAA